MRLARRLLLTAVTCGTVICGAAITGSLAAQASPGRTAPGDAVPSQAVPGQAALPSFVGSATDGRTEALTFIGTPAGRPVDLDRLRGMDGSFLGAPRGAAAATTATESRAELALKAFAPAFGVKDPARELVAGEVVSGMVRGGSGDNGGSSGGAAFKYRQTYQGLPVIGGELVVNLDSRGDLLSLNGEVSPAVTVGIDPAVGAAAATTEARSLALKKHKAVAASLRLTRPALAIYDPRLLGPDDRPARLVWHIEADGRGASGEALRLFILIDARTGAAVLDFNELPHAKDLVTYDGNGNSVLSSYTLRCDELDLECTGAGVRADVTSAHKYAHETYDFYWQQHGRDSFDDAGAQMRSVAYWNSSGECPNAFWDGTYVNLCNGMAVDDVVAHEFTHAVTEKTSNLFYYYQAGAINESLSDIWGELMDQHNPDGGVSTDDSEATDWLIGEGSIWPGAVYGDDPAGTLRDMRSPGRYYQPDSMTSTLYYAGEADNGGVHTNSGVSNKAAYLMVEGGVFNGRTVTALGWEKTLDIWYTAQTTLLTSGADFLDLHNALYQACLNKAGAGEDGVIPADCTEVRDATLAVRMDAEPETGFNPDVTPCPTGFSAPVTTWSDDHEGLTPWVFQWLNGTENPWYYVAGYAYSGLWSLDSLGSPGVADNASIMPTAVPVYGDSFFHMRHSYDLEMDEAGPMDGGVVEYSTDGTNWRDLTVSYQAGSAPTTKPVPATYSSPLSGRRVFSGVSHGYVSTRFDLRDLAGKNVSLRLRTATDSNVTSMGWTVDDLTFVRCGGGPAAPVTTVAVSPAAPDGGSGWYKSAATFTLTRNKSGTTGYQWDGSAPDKWTTYTGAAAAPAGKHTLYYRTVASDGSRESTKSKVLWVDTAAPKGAKISSFGSTTPFARSKSWKVRWGAATDAASGVGSYDVRYREAAYDSGFGARKSWKNRVATGSATFYGRAGYSYCFSARARDKAGNLSAWSAEKCITNPLNNTQLARSSGWAAKSGSGYYLGTYSKTSRAQKTLKTYGKAKVKRIALIVTKCPTCGKVAVYRGSAKLGSFDLRSATTRKGRVVPVKTYSSLRSGTIRIVSLKAGKVVIIEGIGLGKS